MFVLLFDNKQNKKICHWNLNKWHLLHKLQHSKVRYYTVNRLKQPFQLNTLGLFLQTGKINSWKSWPLTFDINFKKWNAIGNIGEALNYGYRVKE